MNPKFLSDKELKEAFEAVKKSALSGRVITGWNSAGTSMSFADKSGTAGATARGNIFAREIAYRIHEGRIPQADFPHIEPLARPPRERVVVGCQD